MTTGPQGTGGGHHSRVAMASGPVGRVVLAFAGVTLGEWVLGTAVAIAAYDAGGALAVGLVGFRFVPAALAGVALAGLPDRVSRTRILTAVPMGRAACTALAAVAFAADVPFGVVLGLVWLDAMIGCAYRPAQAALLPSLARNPGELTASTTLVSNAKSTSQVLGALAGGVLVAVVPVEVALAVAVSPHLAATALTLGLRSPGRQLAIQRGAGGTLHDLGEATRLLRQDAVAARIVGYAGLRSLIRGLWLALAVIASLRLLGLGEAGFGLLMAAAGVGALLSIPACSLLAGRAALAPWLGGSLVLTGLTVALIGASGWGAGAIVLMLVWGVGMSFSDVTAAALLNRVVPADFIARVTAFMESSKLLLEGLGALVAPALVAAFGIRGALIAAGLIVPALVALDAGAFRRIDGSAIGRVALLEFVHAVPLFRPLRVDALEGVVARLTPLDVAAGDVVVQEGDQECHEYFLIESGAFDVLIEGYLVAHLRPGQGFGELALLRDSPRLATVRCVEPGRLQRLLREDFLIAVTGTATEDSPVSADHVHADPREALARAPLLHGIGHKALGALVDDGTVTEYPAGAEITTAGEEDDRFHVLLAGQAEVAVDGERRRLLRAGDPFGEIAVLHRRSRIATVVALGPVTVLTMPGEALRSTLRNRDDPVGALVDLA